jgi:hypothetical protein
MVELTPGEGVALVKNSANRTLRIDLTVDLEALMASGDVYTSTAEGIAATVAGQYFWVAAPGALSIPLYKNVAGVATSQNISIPAGTGVAAEATVQQILDGTPGVSISPAGLQDAQITSTTEEEGPQLLRLYRDEEGNVLLWLEDLALETLNGVGPRLLAKLQDQLGLHTAQSLVTTNGVNFSKFRAKLGNLLGTSSTEQAHLWMTGDSWTEREPIPGAVYDDFAAQGYPMVATGWIGVNSGAGFEPPGGDSFTKTAGTLHDITEEAESGEYGPDGFRLEVPVGGVVTIVSRHKSLTLYATLNGAGFTYATDGGAATPVTLANTSAPGKQTITAAAEGMHTTVITVTSGTLHLCGAFAKSLLPGVIVSKCGNGGSTMEDISGIIDTTTAAYILADVAAACPFSARFCWLTNDSRLSVPVPDAIAALELIIAGYRTALPGCEILFTIPARNGVSGLTAGFDIGDYVDEIIDLANEYSLEINNLHSRWPAYADNTFLWVDTLHLDPDNGGPELMAAEERHSFWEVN